MTAFAARPRPSARRQLGTFLGLLAAALGVGFGSSFFTVGAIPGWYAALRKPRWTPPNRVFGPVWTTLYVLMATAAWLVWRATDSQPDQQRADGQRALRAWWAQLALNAAWTTVFFGRRWIAGGVLVIGPLWATIALTAVLARRVAPGAAVLLVPYFAWTSFAAALNLRIWQLNRGQRRLLPVSHIGAPVRGARAGRRARPRA